MKQYKDYIILLLSGRFVLNYKGTVI